VLSGVEATHALFEGVRSNNKTDNKTDNGETKKKKKEEADDLRFLRTEASRTHSWVETTWNKVARLSADLVAQTNAAKHSLETSGLLPPKLTATLKKRAASAIRQCDIIISTLSGLMARVRELLGIVQKRFQAPAAWPLPAVRFDDKRWRELAPICRPLEPANAVLIKNLGSKPAKPVSTPPPFAPSATDGTKHRTLVACANTVSHVLHRNVLKDLPSKPAGKPRSFLGLCEDVLDRSPAFNLRDITALARVIASAVNDKTHKLAAAFSPRQHPDLFYAILALENGRGDHYWTNMPDSVFRLLCIKVGDSIDVACIAVDAEPQGTPGWIFLQACKRLHAVLPAIKQAAGPAWCGLLKTHAAATAPLRKENKKLSFLLRKDVPVLQHPFAGEILVAAARLTAIESWLLLHTSVWRESANDVDFDIPPPKPQRASTTTAGVTTTAAAAAAGAAAASTSLATTSATAPAAAAAADSTDVHSFFSRLVVRGAAMTGRGDAATFMARLFFRVSSSRRPRGGKARACRAALPDRSTHMRQPSCGRVFARGAAVFRIPRGGHCIFCATAHGAPQHLRTICCSPRVLPRVWPTCALRGGTPPGDSARQRPSSPATRTLRWFGHSATRVGFG
jgi:hypothetical protein